VFAVVAVVAATAASCGRSDSSVPSISLVTPDRGRTAVVVSHLPAATLAALGGGTRTTDEWVSVLKVSVATDAPPIVGAYAVDASALTFTPAFPFDAGRPYVVRFDPAAIGGGAVLLGTVSLPASTAVPSTTVSAVYPSGETLPENLLRLYIHFSAPMGMSGGIDHVQLLDEAGLIVEGAFLPLDYEFWDSDRQRFTAFLDPGRVKRGILPNRQSGRALKRGGRYTLVVMTTWRDGNGLPLKEEFRRTFTAGAAEMRGLDTTHWRIESPRRAGPSGPAAGPLVVSFPTPLDRGLLMRALGVQRDGKPIDGEARVDAGETRWIFTPREPWSPGRYELVALSILEDPAGNQIGKAFEIDNFETIDKSPDPKTITIQFVVGG
jgi:hypothetical protein